MIGYGIAALNVGKDYRTRGGWVARIVWSNADGYYVVHQPGTEQESVPIFHTLWGKATILMSINAPPMYEAGHPADLMVEVEP